MVLRDIMQSVIRKKITPLKFLILVLLIEIIQTPLLPTVKLSKYIHNSHNQKLFDITGTSIKNVNNHHQLPALNSLETETVTRLMKNTRTIKLAKYSAQYGSFEKRGNVVTTSPSSNSTQQTISIPTRVIPLRLLNISTQLDIFFPIPHLNPFWTSLISCLYMILDNLQINNGLMNGTFVNLNVQLTVNKSDLVLSATKSVVENRVFAFTGEIPQKKILQLLYM